MATFNESPDGRPVLLVKGGPGAVLERSTRLATATGPRALAEADRERLRALNVALAGEGLRVLAIAWRPEGWPADGHVDDLTFVGLLGLQDPVKPGVKEAIAQCAAAGIQTVMLTGDQRATAEAVGHQLGLPADAIRSRVSPEDKLELIKALQARAEIVAMTGDGVNDAPALARADIGVAMGGRGTDVAREASDIVLTDDNFATIVRAVAEGRVIYANLRKVIHFLFTANLSEIATIFVAVALGFPAPLLPLQILWVNLVTDILPALALIRDPAEADVMRRPPRDPRGADHVALRTANAHRGVRAGRRRAQRLLLGRLAGRPGRARQHGRSRRARADPPAAGDVLPLDPPPMVAAAAQRADVGCAGHAGRRAVVGRLLGAIRGPATHATALACRLGDGRGRRDLADDRPRRIQGRIFASRQ
jgi:magnesium-transporting ATPase (P-type)